MKLTHTAVALAASLLTPALASAQEATVTLSGVNVPVGPAGTRVMHLDRFRIADAHYAVARVRSPEDHGRCSVSPERLISWGLFNGHWIELQNDVFDRCPADNARHVARSIRAFVMDPTGPSEEPQFNLGVQIIDPRQPITEAPVVRYRLVGQRLLTGHLDSPLAAAVSLPSVRTLTENAMATVDGALSEWGSPAMIASGEHGQVWAAMRGTVMHFAARTEAAADAPATLDVWLAEPGVSTAVMNGTLGNAGRRVQIECAPDGRTQGHGVGEFRCHRDGTTVTIEGSSDLATMLWRHRQVNEVSMLASLHTPHHRAINSEVGMHLERSTLPAGFDVAMGVSEDALALCRDGYIGRVASDPQSHNLGAMITCGFQCQDGRCNHQIGLEGTASRMLFENTPRYAEGCLDLLGPGRDVFHSCQGAEQTRLVGQIPARGYEAVLVVERTQTQHQERRAEVWAIITPSAHWQRLWEGQTLPLNAPAAQRVQQVDAHPTVCRGTDVGAACERIDAVTLVHDEDSVTGEIMQTLAVAGLLNR